MRKAQYNTVYMLVLVAITLIIAVGTFLLSVSFQRTSSKELGNYLLDDVRLEIEKGLLDLKAMSELSYGNISLQVKIPERIGDQEYIVSGSNQTLRIRTQGKPSLVSESEILFWPVELQGAVFSPFGRIVLMYLPAENKVVLK
ncbi:MAG: hypothetical protein QXH80_00540 [Candidatus Nanoarchaeia archaeon]